MISKELLSEVLGKSVDPYYFGMYGNNLEYSKEGSINIYELANKCKKWALKNQCELLSCTRMENSLCDIFSRKYRSDFTHYADTEPEAIFKACEWILQQKESLCDQNNN